MTDVVSPEILARPAGWISAARWRFAFFLIIAAFMLAGPVIEQVLGKRSPFWRSWTMFSGIGIGMVEVSFASRQPDGTLVSIDRFEKLGAPRDGRLKRIEDLHELASIIEQLCVVLGPDADLRVNGRQAQRKGWQVIITDEKNVCAF